MPKLTAKLQLLIHKVLAGLFFGLGVSLSIGTVSFLVYLVLAAVPPGTTNPISPPPGDDVSWAPLYVDPVNQRVGIGTMGPIATLDIRANADYVNSNSFTQLKVGGAGASAKRLMIGYDTTDDFGFIQSVESGAVFKALVLQPEGGNVGIGTVGPNEKLNVVGKIEVGTGSRGAVLRSSASDNFQLQTFTNAPNPNFDIGIGNGTGGIATTWLHGDNSGNVGIGTTNPGAKLEVNGHIRHHPSGHSVEMTNTPGYLEYVIDGNYYGVTIWASSKRFKENITDLEIDSSKIYDLNPVSFNWKPERGGQRDFGIIAEEAAEILPLIVAYDKEGKPFSVKYDLLSVLLLNELKKKAFEINALNETVEQLKTRIEKLEQE